MSWTTRLYQHLAIKAFTPFLSFMVPYLVEQKGFSSKELHNNFSPFFFTSSIVTSLVAFLVIELLGNKLSILADTLLEVAVYLIFVFMPFKGHHWTMLAYVLHGATTSMGVVMKSIITEAADKGASKGVVLSATASIKTFASVISSWVGQDIIMCGGSHHMNMVVSLLSLLLSAAVVFPLPPTVAKTGGDMLVSHLTSPRDMGARMRGAYTEEVVLMSLLSSSASILYICLSFYSANIFLEKRIGWMGNTVWANRVFFVLARPVRLVSYLIIRVFSIFDASVSYHSNPNRPVIVHGYIEGCAKMLSSLAGLAMSKVICADNCVLPAFITSIATMCLICLLGTTESMSSSYLLYVLASLASFMCKNIANIGLSEAREYRFVLSTNLFVSSVVHISITYYSKLHNLSVRSKLMAYFYVNGVFITLALVVHSKRMLGY